LLYVCTQPNNILIPYPKPSSSIGSSKEPLGTINFKLSATRDDMYGQSEFSWSRKSKTCDPQPHIL